MRNHSAMEKGSSSRFSGKKSCERGQTSKEEDGIDVPRNRWRAVATSPEPPALSSHSEASCRLATSEIGRSDGLTEADDLIDVSRLVVDFDVFHHAQIFQNVPTAK